MYKQTKFNRSWVDIYLFLYKSYVRYMFYFQLEIMKVIYKLIYVDLYFHFGIYLNEYI